jgi:hypothetical protein
MRRRPPALALLCATAALVLAGCGSTTVVTETSAAGSGVGSGSRTTTGEASTTAAASTTGAPTTPAGGSTPACTAAMLRLGYLGGRGATGHGELGFSLTNATAYGCHTYGFPGVELLSGSGAPLPTDSTRTTEDFFGATPEAALSVAPGAVVSFRLVVAQGTGSSAGCATAAQLQVIPPDDTHTLVVTIPNGTYECGSADVSPVQPGMSAFH